MPFEQQNQDWTAVHVVGEARGSRWLILCDHASNAVPPSIAGGDLGIAAEDMARHIAFDVGAAGLALKLAERLDAPAVLSNFSRLVIDPNRGEDDPTLVMRLYDGTIIPANRHIDAGEVERRKDMLYRPYHRKVAEMIAKRADTVVISVHSFTRQLKGYPPRPWHVGLLHAGDVRLSRPLLTALSADTDLVVAENQPYGGSLKGDTIDRHALAHGLQNTLIEVRNDLISDESGQEDWARRFADLLPDALLAAEA